MLCWWVPWWCQYYRDAGVRLLQEDPTLLDVDFEALHLVCSAAGTSSSTVGRHAVEWICDDDGWPTDWVSSGHEVPTHVNLSRLFFFCPQRKEFEQCDWMACRGGGLMLAVDADTSSMRMAWCWVRFLAQTGVETQLLRNYLKNNPTLLAVPKCLSPRRACSRKMFRLCLIMHTLSARRRHVGQRSDRGRTEVGSPSCMQITQITLTDGSAYNLYLSLQLSTGLIYMITWVMCTPFRCTDLNQGWVHYSCLLPCVCPGCTYVAFWSGMIWYALCDVYTFPQDDLDAFPRD